MRIGLIPESFVERLLARLPFAPTPLAETHAAFLQARAIMAAVELGVIEALADGPAPAEAVARTCGTDPSATRRLLDALAAARYVRRRGGTYALTAKARRWLVASATTSLRDKLLFQADEWGFVSDLPAFVRTGEPVRLHERLDAGGWARYQKAMRAVARLSAPEVARRTPVPRGATRLLDLGGSHGLFSAALCARHPALRATVLDLPEALAGAAAPSDRVTLEPGDARSADLGETTWDVVLMGNVAHHLDAEENADVARRAARALTPGGTFVYLEWLRPERSSGIGALLDLYFALTSASGTWSAAELRRWQAEAGLRPGRAKALRTMPGTALLPAARPT